MIIISYAYCQKYSSLRENRT